MQQPGWQLLHPVGQHLHSLVGRTGIVGQKMHPEVVRATHIAVHHKRHRHSGFLAWLEDRRTDSRNRRSTPGLDFYIRVLREAQRLIAIVGYLE